MSSIAKPPRRSLGNLIGGASYGRAFRRIEPALDADAAKYLAAVEAADKQVLEDGVKRAVSAFVRACKADGNWDAIKASCILCGARTLAGALVPLKGAAPTNYNFVGLGTDYTRADGLQGDGSTKYLDSNRANDADPQDSKHLSAYISQSETTGFLLGSTRFLGGLNNYNTVGSGSYINSNNQDFVTIRTLPSTGFAGGSRNSSSSFTGRGEGTTVTKSAASTTPWNGTTFVFCRNNTTPQNYSNGTLAFYSIGEAVDLALLDTAVSTLVSEIAAAV